MTQQEAINFITDRINKIDTNNFDPVVWTSGTTSVLKKIFVLTGDSKSNSLEGMSYLLTALMADSDMQHRHKERGKEQARNFLREFITEINTFGLESKGNATVSSVNEQEVVGKTLWDVLGRLFTKKPTIVIATLLGVVLLFLVLVFTGLLKFEIIDGKVSMGFNASGQSGFSSTNKNNSDQLTNWCLTKGEELKKKYVLKSIIQTYDAEL
jgi:hypothetical protein